MRPLALHSFALLAALICCSEVSAQGTAADYERAAKLASRTRGKLLRAAVRPTWLSDSTLWYEVRTSSEQTEAVVIDASAPDGQRRRVAATSETLRSQLGLRQAPRIEGLELDGEEIRLLLRGEAIGARRRGDGPLEAWDPIEAGAFHLSPSPRERASGNNGPEIWILFVNREQEAVELQWVDSSGTRQSYGKIAPGGQRWMRTFAGHEWSLTGEGGRRLVGYRATAQSGIASTRPPTQDKESREPRSARQRRGTPGMRRASSQSPDGKYEASTRNRAIVVTRKSNGKEQALTNDTDEVTGYGRNTYWSADSRSLVVFRTIDPPSRRVTIVRALPKDEIQPRTETYAYRKPGDPIRTQAPRLFTRKGQRFEEVPIDLSQFENPWRLDMAGFEPDGDRFFVRYNQRGHRILRMSAIDGRTGEVRTLVEEAPETFVDYNSKGFARWLDPGKELLWMSERSGFNHLYLVRADEKRFGEITPITSGDWPVFQVDDVDAETRTIRFRAGGMFEDQDPYHVHHGRVSIDTGEITWLTEGDGTHDLTFSPSGDLYLDRYSRVDLPPVVDLRRTEDGSLVTEVERADDSLLRATGWRPPQRFVAKGRDGETDIWGLIVRPTNFDPKSSYPVIENIYAGPHGAHVPKSFRSHRRMAELAELGFVVVRIDGMGTNKRSKAFHDVAWKNLGDAGFPDRILWMKALAKSDPALDVTRVGIYGGSAGGQNAMRALIAHNDFYDVAVADCGCHDNRVDKIWWNELWMSWPIGEHYREASNVEQAHRLEGKLLLTVGAVDRNVDPASTMQVAEALIRADKDFDLIVFPNGGHGIGESPYGVRRRRDYFVEHLLGVTPRR